MCFNFLWKNGPDKIKRAITTQGYEKEGLRMIDIQQFINALKISWIRRSIIENKDCFIIHNTLYPFYDKCLIYGSDFIKSNLDRINNPFWHDTYNAFCGGSFCFMSLCLKYFYAVGALCLFSYFWLS